MSQNKYQIFGKYLEKLLIKGRNGIISNSWLIPKKDKRLEKSCKEQMRKKENK